MNLPVSSKQVMVCYFNQTTHVGWWLTPLYEVVFTMGWCKSISMQLSSSPCGTRVARFLCVAVVDVFLVRYLLDKV